MINDWHQQFNDYNFKFYFVLLAAYNITGDDWSLMRQAQLQALILPNTELATAHDLGDRNSPFGSIHSRNKTIVGSRLALIAQNQMYGFDNVVYSGPHVYDVIWPIDGNDIQTTILRFKSAEASSFGLQLLDTSNCIVCCSHINGSPVQLKLSDLSTVHANVTIASSEFLVVGTVDLSIYKKSGLKVIGLSINWESFSECAIYNNQILPHLPYNISRY